MTSSVNGWTKQIAFKCTESLIVFRNSSYIYGLFDYYDNNSIIKRTYNINQPHWSISVRVDLYIMNRIDSGDYIQIWMNGVQQRQYKRGGSAGDRFCRSSTDEYYQFYKNISHSASTFDLEFKSSINTYQNGGAFSSAGSFGLSQLYIVIDTCFITCLTCSGPAEDQCLTCFTGSTKKDNKCSCNTGFAHQQSCVLSCPTGFRGENTSKICVPDECDTTNCTACDNTNRVCTSCKTGFYLLNTICVTKCPVYTTLSGKVCLDILPSNGMYLLKALMNDFLGESDVKSAGLVITGFEGDGKGETSSSGALTSICKNVYYIGGYMLAGKQALIKRSFTGLPYHSQIRIMFQFVAIDYWRYENMKIRFDGQNVIEFYVDFDKKKDHLCGSDSYQDKVFQVDNKIIHQKPNLDLEIQAGVAGDSFESSYGIRDFIVILEKCSEFCIECEPTKCTKCDNTHYLYNKVCIDSCPSNTFINGRECIDCQISCATCSGGNNTDCITCTTGKLLLQATGSTCVTNCPTDGYYSDGIKCQKCDSTCLSCTLGANNNCTACPSGLFFYKNQCLSNCPPSTYKSGKICDECNNSCATCNGGTATECLSCKASNYLKQTQSTSECVIECGPTLYENTTDNKCSACDFSCQECTGANSDQCTKCSGQRYLQGSKCVTTCDNGLYQGQNNLCTKCESSCKTCNGGTNNNCLTCTLPLYFNLNKCVSICDDNQFQDDATSSCKTCDPSCKTCSGAGKNSQFLNIYHNQQKKLFQTINEGDKKCKSCSSSFLLHVDGSCLDKCPTGYYADGNVCKNCPIQCTSCIQQGGNPVCASCPADQFLYNGQCESVCPSKTYKSNNGTTNVCLSCETSCQTCSGPSNTECKSCVLPNYFYSDTFECKTVCKSKFYPSNPTATCLSCNSACYQCTGPSINECTACQGTLYLQNNTCISTCTKGTFPNSTNNKCEACQSSCATCSGPNETDCITCENLNYLQTDKNSCLSSCKSNEFQNITNNKCTICNISCLTCSGPGSDQCLTCKAGLYLHTIDSKKTCVSTCPDGYYVNGIECSKCTDECLTCITPGDNTSCLTCDSTKFLYEGKCVSSCPQKTYPSTNLTTKVCSKCFQDCLTCIGPQNTDCKSCLSPLYFVAATSECKPGCEPKFFKNESKAECSSCFDKCATCSGPSSNQCLSCSGLTYLDGNSCVDKCTPGKFENTGNNTCGQCEATCKTCNGNTDSNCLTCVSPRYYQPSTKKCVTSCKSNEYKDEPSISCKLCHSTCATCIGPNNDQCTGCFGADALYNGKICKSDCPDGSYKDGLVCKACSSTCKTCIYPGDASKCVTCESSKYLYKGECLSACNNKTFPSTLHEDSKICDDCDQTCANCKGPLSNECTTCNIPNYLNLDQTCKATCDPKFYKNDLNATCSQCHIDCFYCSGPNDNQCTGCQGTKFLENNQCISSCPQKKYQNSIDNICSPCHQSCKTCDGPLITNCTSCESPNFMQTGSKECKSICNPNEYRDSSTQTCKICHQSCKTCSGYGADKCLSCNGKDVLHQGNICVTNCPSGYYKDVNVCKKCIDDCKTCDYPGDSTTCLSCPQNKYLLNNQCLATCPDKYYPQNDTDNNICLSCHSTCLSCKGPQSTECIKCNSPFYYNPVNKQCSSQCDDHYYKNDTLSTCSLCDTTCSTCDGPNPNSCLSCSGSKFLDGANCIDDCPTNKFKNLANNICTACHPTCKTCTGTNASECLTCTTQYYLQTSSKECKITCNINEFKDSSSLTCILCNKTCKTCSGTGTDKCLSCNTPDLLIDGKSCISACPGGYYSDSIACKHCDLSCKRCNSPGDNMSCSACQSDKYLYKGQCISQCPNNFFIVKNIDTNVCTQCDPSCETCSGQNTNQCISCKIPNYLNEVSHECKTSCDQRYYQNDQFAICTKCNDSCFECTGSGTNQCKSCSGARYLDVSTCVEKCPIGKFERDSDNLCAICHKSCKTCNGTASTNCLSCSSPLYFQRMTNECSDQCYSSQFKNDINFTCENCNNSCNSCKGAASNQCLSCKGTNLLHEDNTCISQCPDGFYQDGQTCKKCSTECLTCSPPGSNKSCLSCISDKFIYQGQCQQKCPSQTFISIIQGVKTCVACDSSCLTCSGSTKNQCLSCLLPKYFNPKTNECTLTCDDGYYQNDQKVDCSPCDKSCYKCNGPAVIQCTGCIGEKYLDSQKCTSDCPAGKYKNPIDNTCLECRSKCKSCTAQNPNICESCSLPYYFQSRDKTCQLNCQQDQYRDDASASCVSCHSTCETCLGNKDNDCLTCTGTNYLDNKKCVDTCPIGLFANKAKNRCEKCNRNCKTCFGPDAENCLSCQLPLFYQKNGKFCASHCEKNQFSNDQNVTCEDCHDTCATCKGNLINQCLSCPGSLNLYENTCIDKCPEKYYAELNLCKSCTDGCLVCQSGANNRCQFCDDRYFIHEGKCLKKCPEFFFEGDQGNRCEPCSSNCSQCVNSGSLTCLRCGNNHYLYNNSCIHKCPFGTYIQDKGCFNCYISCVTCSGPQDTQCLSCQPNMYLQGSQCVSSCDTGYVQILNSQVCAKCDSTCETCSGSGSNQCLTCKQDTIPFGTSCLRTCPENFFQIPGELQCSNCKSYCSKCTTGTDCQACSKGYAMFNGECLSTCPNQDYYVDENTNSCTLCDVSCKGSGCYGPSENDCVMNFVEAKESILFIIFMTKLGYWLFSSISGYFMDKVDDGEYKKKIILYMNASLQPTRIQNTTEYNPTSSNIEDVKRKEINKFEFQRNQTTNDLNNNVGANQNQTLQNVTLNTSNLYYNQNIDQKLQFNTTQQMSPLKNQNSQYSWRLQPHKELNNQNQQNTQSHRPIRKPFFFVPEEDAATFREQEDNPKSASQIDNNNNPQNNIENPESIIENPIDLPYDQKLYYMLIGNDLISTWTLYNPQLSRIFRATLVYFKFLCFFFATEQIYKKNPGLLIACIIVGMLVKEIVFIFLIQFAICLRKSGAISISFLGIGIIIFITVWFKTEILRLSTQKDITWSWMYLTVFLIDFILIQSLIALIRYMSSLRYLQKYKDKTQILLNKIFVDQGMILKIQENMKDQES